MLVVVVDDNDPIDIFARHVVATTGTRPEWSAIRIAHRLVQNDLEALDLIIAEHAPSCRRRLFAGFGSAGSHAIISGIALGADAVFAVAPLRTRTPNAYPTAGFRAFKKGRTRLHLLWGQEPDETLNKAFAGLPISLETHRVDLLSAALPVALHQSGCLVQILDTLAQDGDWTKFANLHDIWRQSFNYALELDSEALDRDAAGTLHVRGRFCNRSDNSFELGTDRILIGARVRNGGGLVAGCEARSGFVRPKLEPGETSAFRLTLPNFELAAADTVVEIGLVCEGRFWLDAVGFPMLKLEVR